MNTVEVSPYLWEIDNILSKEECSIIIDTAKPLLERNTVVDDSKIQGSRVADVRTSSGAHFNKDMKYSLEFDMIRRKIEYAISEFTKLPIENQEGFQVLHYEVNEEYKAQIIESIPENEKLSLYTQDTFTDLCRGPHIPSTGKIKAFKLMKVAGAYWRGDSSNVMLQRIYGTAWQDKKSLKTYKIWLSNNALCLAWASALS